jgi:DnaJ-class molecular chaperone
MKCGYCNGTGEHVNDANRMTTCEFCGGTGVIKPMTNEEWFCQLPTTEKSEFLSAMVKQAIKVYEIHGITWHESVSWWDGWLKEKHE